MNTVASRPPRLLASPAFARVAPFALFMAFLAAQPLLEGRLDTRWLVVLRGLAAGAVLVALWRRYGELRAPRPSAGMLALAIAAGVAVFGAWIAFDSGWAAFEQAGAGFVPLREDGSLDPVLAALRLLGMVAVVPVMEELFWRSFLMRWIDGRDFLAVDPKRASALAFALSSALFASEHSQWFAGLLAGVAYGALYLRSGNLWIPILSHATTNAILGTWILATGHWHYW